MFLVPGFEILGPEVQWWVTCHRSNTPCGNCYKDENRTQSHRQHRKQPVDPQGNNGPAPCAETLVGKPAPKGANRAPVWATVWSLETQMAGKPSYSRPHADCTPTSMPLSPEGDIRHTSELARDAGREKAFEGGRTAADGPRA